MMNPVDLPPFLEQSSHRVSVKEAERMLDILLRKVGVIIPSTGKHSQSITVGPGTEYEKKYTFTELVAVIRSTGVCVPVQKEIDLTDPIYGGTSFGMSTPNWQMPISFSYCGYTKTLPGPCTSTPSEFVISQDIEFYKEEACIESDDHDFTLCYRNYRGYLFSCLALVDAYINRHIFINKFKGRNDDIFIKLSESRNTQERVELFVKCFCRIPLENLKRSKVWNRFVELRDLRNEIVHATTPYLGVSIQEIARNLNYSKQGIGTLLKLFQEWQGKHSLSFIESIRYSPLVHFNQITFRADNKHVVKRIQTMNVDLDGI